jgi:hypothetical protein
LLALETIGGFLKTLRNAAVSFHFWHYFYFRIGGL